MSVYYFFHWAKGPRRNDDLTKLCHGEVFFICVLFNLIHVVFRVGLRFTEDKVTCNNSIPFCKIDYSVTGKIWL